MSWLQRIAQRFTDTQFWGHQFHRENPDYAPDLSVYQSSDFPHVFLGGEGDLDEAQQMAGQPICKVVDCRDLPEIDVADWDYPEYLAAQKQFDAKVQSVIQLIGSTQCPIFIHCVLGANRSVAVLAAALAQLTGRSIHQLLGEMKQARMVVAPQDPYYLMALQHSPQESPQLKQQRFDELNQDFPLVQPSSITAQTEIPPDFPDDLLGDLDLLHEEKQWRRAIGTPGSLVRHRQEGWTGKVVELRGDPVNGGRVLIEHQMQSGIDEGATVQRFHRPLDFEPVMQMASPFRRASWLGRMAQEQNFEDWEWQDTEGDLDVEPFVQNYGLTSNFSESGYILPDGRMLDFSEKSQGGSSGLRSLDHRDVGGGTEGMIEFMRRSGAVRFGSYGGSANVDYFFPLTNQQASAITRLIPRLESLSVDVRGSSGRVMFSESAEGRMKIAELWRSVQG